MRDKIVVGITQGDTNGIGYEVIIKALAEQMGGTTEVQSSLGKGTTFWVTLPCDVKAIVKRSDINV